ncbi:MAG: hypothetical protein ACK56I_22635, partial [bacterium]
VRSSSDDLWSGFGQSDPENPAHPHFVTEVHGTRACQRAVLEESGFLLGWVLGRVVIGRRGHPRKCLDRSRSSGARSAGPPARP